VKLVVIGPCRVCARAGVARVDDTETDLCVMHAVDAVERGEQLFVGKRSITAVRKEGEKRQTLRQGCGWSS